MIIFPFLMHVLFAGLFPICRVAVKYADPIFFTGARMLVCGLGLLAFIRWRGCSLRRPTFRAVIHFAIFAIFGIFITNAAECWSLQFLPAAKASFMYQSAPFYAALLAYMAFGETMTSKKFAGMFVALAGFLVMVLHEAPLEVQKGGILFISGGELALLAAALTSVFGYVALRRLVRDHAYSSVEACAVAMTLGGVITLVASFFMENWNPVPIHEMWPFIKMSFWAILCGNIAGYVFYGYLLKFYTTTFLSFAGFSELISAALTGYFLLGEPLAWPFYVATVLVMIGLYMFYIEELRQGYVLPMRMRPQTQTECS